METDQTNKGSVPAVELVREAMDEVRELTRLEIALAKDEAKSELRAFRASAILFAVAGSSAVLGAAMLLITLGLAIGSWLVTLVIGISFVVIAAIACAIGAARLPKKVMPETQRRVETDFRDLKEHIV